jgi:hypothetical protein
VAAGQTPARADRAEGPPFGEVYWAGIINTGRLVERLWAEVDEEVNEPLDRLLAKAAENERLNLQPGADMNGKRVIILSSRRLSPTPLLLEAFWRLGRKSLQFKRVTKSLRHGGCKSNSVGFAMLDRNDGLQATRRVSGSVGVAFHVPPIRYGGSGQTSRAGRQVRQGGVRPQKRAPDYPVVAARAGLLLFIAASTFALGMAIHNEALAQYHAPRPETIYHDDGYLDGLAGALGYDSVEQMGRAGRPRSPPNVAHRRCLRSSAFA